MLNIQIICIGKLKEKYWRDACCEYEKRLKGFCRFSIIELDETKAPDNPSDSELQKVIESEGERIINKIPNNALVIPMCIEGKILSSEKLSDYISKSAVNGVNTIAFVIGGSWGLSEKVKQKGKLQLSMSEMTFPHQLARIMLCEQIYRAFQIMNGGKYHK